MARTTRPAPKSNTKFGWRGFVVFILSLVGLISLIGFSFAHWTDRQLLNTDHWVKLVAPLPKNDAVATSLSDYSVTKLFDSVNVEQKIADALPPNASFLAEPLSNQLEGRIKNRTKQVIQSDKFQGIWVSANRVAHKTLVDKARGNTANTAAAKTKTRFNLDLSSLGGSIREKLGNSSLPLFQNDQASGDNDKKIGVAVSLKTSFEKFKKFVNSVDFLNGVLGFLAFASLLWAIAIARNRRRLLMILSATTGIIALLQIIGVKAVRPIVLNQIETKSYTAAVGYIYDTLVASFEHMATVLFVASLLIFSISFLVGYSRLTRSSVAVRYIRTYKSHRLYKALQNLRQQAGKYRYGLMGGVVVVVLIALALMSGYDWQGVLRAGLFAASLCALIRLFAIIPNTKATRRTPM